MPEAKTLTSVRIDPSDLAAIDKIGAEMKPVPLNRNVMIGLAVREYIERHKAAKAKPPKK